MCIQAGTVRSDATRFHLIYIHIIVIQTHVSIIPQCFSSFILWNINNYDSVCCLLSVSLTAGLLMNFYVFISLELFPGYT